MANLFSKAAAKAVVKEPSSSSNHQTFPATDKQVAAAIDALEKAKKDEKKAQGDKKTAKAVAEPWVRRLWFKIFCDSGRFPDTFIVKGTTSELMWIAQNRAGVNDVSNEQLELLKNLLGEKRAEQAISEFTEFSLSNEILNLDGVADALSKAIEKIPNNILNAEQKEALLVGKARRILKDNIIDDLAQLTSNDPEQMEQVADALGSNLTMYLK